MTRLFHKTIMLGLGLGVAACMGFVATAQETAQAPATDRATDKAARQADRAGRNAGRLDARTSGDTIRASQLIGMNIQNSQGDGIGEINDLVIDAQNGKVRYAAVTYGGFLGLGDKLFAVPFEAFTCQRNPNDPDDPDNYVLMLDVTEQQMEGAKGFDQENWPNFADKNFTQEVNRRYGVERRMQNRGNRDGVNVDVDRNGVDVDVDRQPNRSNR